HKRLHRFQIVVHASEQNALVSKRDARVGETLQGLLHLNCQLARMIHMHTHPEGMIFRENRPQLRCDALRQENRDARTDSKELNVRNRPQPRKQFVELIVAENESIATAQEDIAHLGMRFEITKRFLEICVEFLFAHTADNAAASAITAITGATIRY